MSDQLTQSPRFKKPPVVETILGVYFRPIDGFGLIQRVQLWSQQFAADFPAAEERPPLEEVREEFDSRLLQGGPQVQVRWQFGPPSPRIWAKSTDGGHTLQIQQDALFANWERVPDSEAAYVDYPVRKRDFEQRLQQVDRYLRENDIGRIEPTSCFVTYINHVELGPGVEFAGALQRLLTVWRNDTSDGWLPPVESVRQSLSFPMPNKAGRLHVTVNRAIRNRDNQQIVRLDLTARGTPSEPTAVAALNWLDLGHDWVVRGFASLTRREMHEEWGRCQ